MLKTIKSFFKKEIAIEKEVQAKESVDSTKLQLATCALLLEMAHADSEFSAEEEEHILATMKEHLNLSQEAADELIELSERARKESIDLWQFTQLIKSNYSVEQKIKVIEMIWRVVYVDGILDKHEDYLVHKLAMLLGLEHKQLIDAKVKILQEKRAAT